MIKKKTKRNSNTTLVKVKFGILLTLFMPLIDSNTTLVKVKLKKQNLQILLLSYSNTTLVKVKLDSTVKTDITVKSFKYNTC